MNLNKRKWKYLKYFMFAVCTALKNQLGEKLLNYVVPLIKPGGN